MGSFFSGQEGESLFHEPLLRFFRHNPLPDLFSKTAGLTDDRLLAIVTALVVEQGVDVLLGSFLPGYKHLAEERDFTISLKIGLAKALGFIPPRILRAATMIRKIRNEFAHDLDIGSFAQLKEDLIRDLTRLRIEIYRHSGADQTKPEPSLVEEYSAIAFFCIAGLDAYRENLAYLRSKIQTPKFIASLFEESTVENESELREVLEQEPISVEIRDGARIERYSRGVVRVSGGQDVTLDVKDILAPTRPPQEI
jgi:hypothetical protein